jgi:hypothetical protein
MYRLIMDGTETTYNDPEDPGKEATPQSTKCSMLRPGRIDSSMPMISLKSLG